MEPAMQESLDIAARRADDLALWRESERLQLVLAELSMQGRRTLRDAFAIIAETAATALKVERVSLWRYHAAQSKIVCAAAWQRGVILDDTTVISKESHPTYWKALHETRTLCIADAVHDPRLIEFRKDYVGPLGIGAMLDSGIRVERTTFGIVCVEQLGASRVWTTIEQMFVASLGDRVGLALLLEEQRRAEHERANDHLLEALGLMAAGLAHDFNNVLSVVLTATDLARESVERGADPRDDLEVIKVAAHRAASMTRRLLALARRDEMSMVRVDLNTVIEDFASIARRLVPPSVELRFALAPEQMIAMADHTFVDQVLLNLVTNAVQAMPHGGQLEISSTLVTRHLDDAPIAALPAGEYIRLSVRDSGVGIDTASIPRVFDPFFTTKAGTGTGLGLSTVYAGMQQHRGAVTIDSEAGQGCTIHIYFPAAH